MSPDPHLHNVANGHYVTWGSARISAIEVMSCKNRMLIRAVRPAKVTRKPTPERPR